jgi:hypothetical protein
MDDAQFNKKGGLTLCSDSFTLNEVILLKDTLFDNFNLICSIHIKNILKGQYRIYISKKSLNNLQSLTNNYIIDSMKYKINL